VTDRQTAYHSSCSTQDAALKAGAFVVCVTESKGRRFKRNLI